MEAGIQSAIIRLDYYDGDFRLRACAPGPRRKRVARVLLTLYRPVTGGTVIGPIRVSRLSSRPVAKYKAGNENTFRKRSKIVHTYPMKP
jgi:hypothetical protein